MNTNKSSSLSSSSSPPIVARLTPNPRNSEITNPIRRSFTGSPFSNSRSPSENPRRSSMGRETVDDKENGKDPTWKQIRVRSPVGSKNFMSPTISAAIKITAASPRKKILSERNEPVRTSISSAAAADVVVKTVTFAPTTVEIPDHADVVPTTPTLVSKSLVDVESMECCPEDVCGNASEELDCVNLDPSFKISPPPAAGESGRIIAPLDANPSVPPPYDPKTNYLSPRPQFLHYRPNPRVEYYMSKEGGGKRLEESFISESFEERFVSESFSDESSEETESWDDSLKEEVEDVTSSVEVVKQEEAVVEKVEEEAVVSDSVPVSITMPKAEEAVGVEGSSMPRRFVWRSKFTALVMVLLVAAVSVLAVNSPLTDGVLLKDMSLLREYDRYKMVELARESFDGLVSNVQVWSANSVAFISEFISSIRGVRNVGPLQFYNLTMMEADGGNEYSVFDQCNKEMEEMGEFDEFGKTSGSVFDIETLVEMGLPEIGVAECEKRNVEEAIEPLVEKGQPDAGAANSAEELVEQESEQVNEFSEETEPLVTVSTENLVEVHADPESEEKAELNNTEDVSQENSNFENGEALQSTQAIAEENIVSDPLSVQPESTLSIKEETALISGAFEVPEVQELLQTDSEMSTVAEVEYGSHGHALTVEGADSMVPMVSLPGLAFLVLALVGFTTFVYMKKRNSSSPSPASDRAVQPLVTRKVAGDPIETVSTDNTYCPSEMSGTEEHTYCPSGMSSFQTSSLSRRNGLEASDGAESREKRSRTNNRRDSVASIDSSMGSPGYGSFTTYERIPTKKGYGEEEVVTPVRRSSRIIRK